MMYTDCSIQPTQPFRNTDYQVHNKVYTAIVEKRTLGKAAVPSVRAGGVNV